MKRSHRKFLFNWFAILQWIRIFK